MAIPNSDNSVDISDQFRIELEKYLQKSKWNNPKQRSGFFEALNTLIIYAKNPSSQSLLLRYLENGSNLLSAEIQKVQIANQRKAMEATSEKMSRDNTTTTDTSLKIESVKTNKTESVNEYDEWRNTRIQAKNIFRMLKQKYNNDISKMKDGLELLFKQNNTKDDQAEIVRDEFNKFFNIKTELNESANQDDLKKMKMLLDEIQEKCKSTVLSNGKKAENYIQITVKKGKLDKEGDKELLMDEKKSLTEMEKNPCWDGYVAYGTKMKNGKEVPNCVPVSEAKGLSLKEAEKKKFSFPKDTPKEKETPVEKPKQEEPKQPLVKPELQVKKDQQPAEQPKPEPKKEKPKSDNKEEVGSGNVEPMVNNYQIFMKNFLMDDKSVSDKMGDAITNLVQRIVDKSESTDKQASVNSKLKLMNTKISNISSSKAEDNNSKNLSVSMKELKNYGVNFKGWGSDMMSTYVQNISKILSHIGDPKVQRITIKQLSNILKNI
jgi:hypothetical protein